MMDVGGGAKKLGERLLDEVEVEGLSSVFPNFHHT
jgi:carbon monoxide dehydrogenase subunit G